MSGGTAIWRSSAAEAIANATIGFAVSWAATLLVLGYTPAQSLGVTAMFFGLSFTRSWALRRVFKGMSNA